MFSMKVTHNNEVRRVQVEVDSNKPDSFAGVQNTVRNIFPDLKNKSFSLVWQDDEGDRVTVSSSQELNEAVRVQLELSMNNHLRFEVKVGSHGVDFSRIVHSGVTCDECGVSPIQGVRFKCAVREDYDLCETCEGKQAQPYAMLKITDPAQAPTALIFAHRGHGGEQGRQGGPHGHSHPHGHGRGFGGRGGHCGRGGPHHGFGGLFGGRGHHFPGAPFAGGPFGGPHHPFVQPPYGCPFPGPYPAPGYSSPFPGHNHFAPPPFSPPVACPYFEAQSEQQAADPPATYLNVEVPPFGRRGRCGRRGYGNSCARNEEKERNGQGKVGTFVTDLLGALLGGAGHFAPDTTSPPVPASASAASEPVSTPTTEPATAASEFACELAGRRERDLNDEDEALQKAISESISPQSSTSSAAAEQEEAEEDVEDVPLPGAADYVEVRGSSEGAAESKEEEVEEEPSKPSVYEQWAKELQLLSNMGFTDFPAMVPLLVKFVETPNVATPQHVDGMQRVVATLLSQSGVSF